RLPNLSEIEPRPLDDAGERVAIVREHRRVKPVHLVARPDIQVVVQLREVVNVKRHRVARPRAYLADAVHGVDVNGGLAHCSSTLIFSLTNLTVMSPIQSSTRWSRCHQC